MTQPLELAEKLGAAHKGKKPLLAAFMGGTEVAAAKEKLMALGIPNYPSPDRAVTALRAMCDYAAWQRRPAAHRHALPGQPPARGPHHQRAGRAAASRRWARSRRRKSCAPTTSTCSAGQLAADRRRGRGNCRAHRLPGRAENFLARHHSQIRFRRRADQPRQRRAGARRL